MRRNPKRDRTKRTTLSNPTRSGGHISAISRKQPRTISLLGSPSDKMDRPPLSPHPRPKNKAGQRSPRSDRPPVFKRRSWPWSSTPPKAAYPPPPPPSLPEPGAAPPCRTYACAHVLCIFSRRAAPETVNAAGMYQRHSQPTVGRAPHTTTHPSNPHGRSPTSGIRHRRPQDDEGPVQSVSLRGSKPGAQRSEAFGAS